jgi:hypothetical protein
VCQAFLQTLCMKVGDCLQAASSEPDYHVLQYTYVPDILEKRGPYRAEHLEGAKKMVCLIDSLSRM